MAQGRQSSEWFVKDQKGVRGPFSEADLRKIVKQSSDPRLQVRQGESPWHPADVIRRKMDELAASGIYVCFGNVAEGPFTITRAHELLQTVSSDGIKVRIGKRGKWVPAKAWLDAVENLKRKRQEEQPVAAVSQDDNEPLANSKSGPDPIAPIKLPDDHDDETIVEGVVIEEDIVEAVLVEVPEAIPVEPILKPGHDPVAHTPIHAAPPFIPRPAHVSPIHSRAAVRSRPERQNSRNTSGAGGALMKIAGGMLSIFLVVGFLGLMALKVGGKQALRQHQADEREQQQRSSLHGSARSGSGIPSSTSERSETQHQLPSSRTGSRGTLTSNAKTPPRIGPPVVSMGMLFRPTFVTRDGVVDAGTAFAARMDGRQETFVISALHLFGPAGGLDRDIPSAVLSDRWEGLSLQDCKSQLVHSDVPMRPIPLTLAKPLPSTSPHGDVVVCSVQNAANLRFQPFPLARDRPRSGEPVWLVSEVMGSSSLVHAAMVEGVEDGWLIYRFESPVELRATSGAPVVNGSGQVVAVNAGGGVDDGVTFGVGTPTANFANSLANGL